MATIIDISLDNDTISYCNNGEVYFSEDGDSLVINAKFKGTTSAYGTINGKTEPFVAYNSGYIIKFAFTDIFTKSSFIGDTTFIISIFDGNGSMFGERKVNLTVVENCIVVFYTDPAAVIYDAEDDKFYAASSSKYDSLIVVSLLGVDDDYEVVINDMVKSTSQR
jgi:hypothetical protein